MSAVEEVSKGLVYNPELSSVLVCSSNCTTEASQQHNCDQDAEQIISALKEAKVIGDSRSTLLTTASGKCTKKGLKEAIFSQASTVTQDEYGLFIFVYCGGACDLTPILVSQSESEGFVVVDIDTKSPGHALVLTDSDCKDKESLLSGQEIAATIASSPIKPNQILVILDCPYAAEIGEDFEKHLQGPCELNLIVSQQKDKKPYYLSPLKGSTFTHFFCHFLSTQEFTGRGMVKLRCLFKKVQTCCHALSSLIMVHARSVLTCNTAAPEGRFVQITQSADEVMKVIESTVVEDGAEFEETDSGGMFGKFLKKYYKKYFFKKPVYLCKEVKDWVHFVMQGPLQELQEQGVLEGQVLSAVVSAMAFSMATIQSALQGDSIGYSNLFLQAYVYIAAAVEMVNQDINTQDVSLLKQALESYTKVARAKKIDEGELNELKTKIEKDTPNVFV